MIQQKFGVILKVDSFFLLFSIFVAFFIGCAGSAVSIKDTVGIQKVKSVVLICGQAEFACKEIGKDPSSGSIVYEIVTAKGSVDTYSEINKIITQLGLFTVTDQSEFKGKIAKSSIEVPEFIEANGLNIPKIVDFAKELRVDGVLIIFYRPFDSVFCPNPNSKFMPIISKTETVPCFEGVLVSTKEETVVWRAKKSSIKLVYGEPKDIFETRLKVALEKLFKTLTIK